MGIYRELIDKDLNIGHLSNKELSLILDDVGRKIIYEYLLLGKNFTYEEFLEVLKMYLKILETTNGEIENL